MTFYVLRALNPRTQQGRLFKKGDLVFVTKHKFLLKSLKSELEPAPPGVVLEIILFTQAVEEGLANNCDTVWEGTLLRKSGPIKIFGTQKGVNK